MTTRRRQSMWIDSLHEFDVASGARSERSLLATFTEFQTRLQGMTLARVILCHDYSYTVHDSGEGSQVVTVGIGLASQEAFAATTLPDPEADADFPQRGWVYRCRHVLHGFAADQPAVDVRSVYRDLRAMRKVDNSELFISVVNTNKSGTTSAINVVGIVRCLFLV